MPHDLATINGHTAMMYYGETPWHDLGQRLDAPATAAQAIAAAQLDWEVEKLPLQMTRGTRLLEVPRPLRHRP